MKIETEHLQDDGSIILEIIRRISALENEMVQIEEQLSKAGSEIKHLMDAVNNLGGF